jgi:hypothetical protein
MTAPTEYDLIRLLEAKDAAQAAYSAAHAAAWKAAQDGLPAPERVALDIAMKKAVTLSVAADLAYGAALSAYAAAQADAA